MEYRTKVKAGQSSIAAVQKMVRSLEKKWGQPVVAYVTGDVLLLSDDDDDDVKKVTFQDPIEILEFIPPPKKSSSGDDDKGMLLVATDCWWPDNDPYNPSIVVGWCVIPTENTMYELCSAFIMPTDGVASVLGLSESQQSYLASVDSQGNSIKK